MNYPLGRWTAIALDCNFQDRTERDIRLYAIAWADRCAEIIRTLHSEVFGELAQRWREDEVALRKAERAERADDAGGDRASSESKKFRSKRLANIAEKEQKQRMQGDEDEDLDDPANLTVPVDASLTGSDFTTLARNNGRTWTQRMTLMRRITDVGASLPDDELFRGEHKKRYEMPVWWNRSLDQALLIGAFKYGLGHFGLMFCDAELPFAHLKPCVEAHTRQVEENDPSQTGAAGIPSRRLCSYIRQVVQLVEHNSLMRARREERLRKKEEKDRQMEEALEKMQREKEERRRAREEEAEKRRLQRVAEREERLRVKAEQEEEKRLRRLEETKERFQARRMQQELAKQAHWSKDEKKSVIRTLQFYGWNKEWTSFKARANLKHKSKEKILQYVSGLISVCEKCAKYEQNSSTTESLFDKEQHPYKKDCSYYEIRLRMAPRLHARLKFFEELRELNADLSSLKGFKNRPGFPGWWTYTHDLYLLMAVSECGLESDSLDWQAYLGLEECPFYKDAEGNELNQRREFLKSTVHDRVSFVRYLRLLCNHVWRKQGREHLVQDMRRSGRSKSAGASKQGSEHKTGDRKRKRSFRSSRVITISAGNGKADKKPLIAEDSDEDGSASDRTEELDSDSSEGTPASSGGGRSEDRSVSLFEESPTPSRGSSRTGTVRHGTRPLGTEPPRKKRRR